MEAPATRARARPRSRRKRERRSARFVSTRTTSCRRTPFCSLHTVLLWDCWRYGKLSPSLAHIHSSRVHRCMQARLCTVLSVCS